MSCFLIFLTCTQVCTGPETKRTISTDFFHVFAYLLLVTHFFCEYPQVIHIVIHLYTCSVRSLVSKKSLDTK